MTRFYLIRHGEPDWEMVDRLGLVGRDREFATLTEKGIREIERAASDPRLRDAEIIICSPYPRALHSGHVLSKILHLPLIPERDLHEWLSFRDVTRPRPHEETESMWWKIVEMDGRYPPPDEREWDWESPDEMRARALPVLRRYTDRKCVIAVTHAGVIYALNRDAREVHHGDIVEMVLNQ